MKSYLLYVIILKFIVTYQIEKGDVLIAEEFINYINKSPSPWHAVDATINALKKSGFVELKLDQIWQLRRQGKYFLTKSKSTLLAFIIGGKYINGNGFSIIAAHTDSPSLRVKPISKKTNKNYVQLGIQTYGSGMWYSWFDRDLTLAGIITSQKNSSIQFNLFNANKPILKIPTIATHLHSYQKEFSINNEFHLVPILSLKLEDKETNETSNHQNSLTSSSDSIKKTLNQKYFSDGHDRNLMEFIANTLNLTSPHQILDMDLCLADTQPATLGGLNDEFIFAPRLDNLFGSFTAFKGFLESLKGSSSLKHETNVRVLALFDHEEVGSRSNQGAGSSFTKSVLRRLATSPLSSLGDETNSDGGYDDAFERAIEKSFLISSDQAHAVHPNYVEAHESNHQVKLDEGLVIKYDGDQRYSTTALTASVLRLIAQAKNIPLQAFINRNDERGGSTIGPILSSLLGVRTIDVGAPQLSMHSIRETCATVSVSQAIRLYKVF
ncbi:unnamed protein product [Gordionus sp. m RMFG-2023]